MLLRVICTTFSSMVSGLGSGAILLEEPSALSGF